MNEDATMLKSASEWLIVADIVLANMRAEREASSSLCKFVVAMIIE